MSVSSKAKGKAKVKTKEKEKEREKESDAVTKWDSVDVTDRAKRWAPGAKSPEVRWTDLYTMDSAYSSHSVAAKMGLVRPEEHDARKFYMATHEEHAESAYHITHHTLHWLFTENAEHKRFICNTPQPGGLLIRSWLGIDGLMLHQVVSGELSARGANSKCVLKIGPDNTWVYHELVHHTGPDHRLLTLRARTDPRHKAEAARTSSSMYRYGGMEFRDVKEYPLRDHSGKITDAKFDHKLECQSRNSFLCDAKVPWMSSKHHDLMLMSNELPFLSGDDRDDKNFQQDLKTAITWAGDKVRYVCGVVHGDVEQFLENIIAVHHAKADVYSYQGHVPHGFLVRLRPTPRLVMEKHEVPQEKTLPPAAAPSSPTKSPRKGKKGGSGSPKKKPQQKHTEAEAAVVHKAYKYTPGLHEQDATTYAFVAWSKTPMHLDQLPAAWQHEEKEDARYGVSGRDCVYKRVHPTDPAFVGFTYSGKGKTMTWLAGKHAAELNANQSAALAKLYSRGEASKHEPALRRDSPSYAHHKK